MKASKGQGIKITPALKKKIIEIVDERIKEAHVTREDFSELKAIVKDLAEAQKRTELKVGDLAEAQKRTEIRLEELAEAQKRTELRLEELAEAQKKTELRLEELAEAQKRTEIRLEELAEAQKRTETRVEELAEAQKRTELRLEELAEAQKKTELRLEELAEAQKRTEEEVGKLAKGLNRTREELGGLARSVSYGFENEAYRMLPGVLAKYGIEVEEKIIRAEVGGKEINFFGRARKNGKEVYIVGEVKMRLDDTKKREDAFEELEEKVEAVKSEYGDVEVVRLLVTRIMRTEEMIQLIKLEI
jgi:DNA repair ATPase RecN